MTNEFDNLRADPAELTHYGTRLRNCADDARGEFDSQHRKMEDTAQGWAPASQAALYDVLGRWKTTTQKLTDAVDHHGHFFGQAAYRFQGTDSRSAQTFNADRGRAGEA